MPFNLGQDIESHWLTHMYLGTYSLSTEYFNDKAKDTKLIVPFPIEHLSLCQGSPS